MNLHLPMNMPAPARTSLDTPSGWSDSPEAAFFEWMRGVPDPCAEKSLVVYGAMWGKFVDWIYSHGVDLTTCTATDVASFLASIHVSPLHEQRYLRIIARVWEHLVELGIPVTENVGKREKGKRARRGDAITPHTTSFLSNQDIARLEEVLREVFERPLPDGQEEQGKEWVERRDAALVGVMLGTGMKLGEVLVWSYYSVNRTGTTKPLLLDVPLLNMPDNASPMDPLLEIGDWIALPRFGVVGPRTVPNFLIGQEALRAWKRCRDHYGLDETVPTYGKREYRTIFPADIARRRDDQERRRDDQEHRTPQLDPRNAWRRISALLERAMIPGKLATTQALRNTYAAQLLQAGYTDASIRDYLGLLLEGSATRIRVARDGRAAGASM